MKPDEQTPCDARRARGRGACGTKMGSARVRLHICTALTAATGHAESSDWADIVAKLRRARLPDVTHSQAIAGVLLRLDRRSVASSAVTDPLPPQSR
jgi:hypothetical protein